MKRRVRWTITAAAMVLLSVPLGGHAADVTIAGVGTTTFRIPGLGSCTSPTVVALKTSKPNFAYTGAILGGKGNPGVPGSFCVLQNISWNYLNKTPAVVLPCQPVPIVQAIGGPQTAPAKLVVVKSTYTITQVIKSCVVGSVKFVHTLTVKRSTIAFSFKEFINRARKPIIYASGTLTRAS